MAHLSMVYLLQMVIFMAMLNNQMVYTMDDLSLPSILENLHMGHNYMATITIQRDLMGHVNQP